MATKAKPKHLEARALALKHLDLHKGKTVGADLDPLEAGIVGDTRHGSGYHLSPEDNSSSDYSRDESPRDRMNGRGYASAMDIGYFNVRGTRRSYDLYDFNAWLIGLCNKNDPDTRDIREVIYSPDGRTVRRWDRLKRRSTGDLSHRTHTHLSEFRDATGQRMVNLMRRWLQHIGLLPGQEDDLPSAKDLWTYPISSPAYGVTKRQAADWLKVASEGVLRDLRKLAAAEELRHRALIAAVTSPADAAQIVAAIDAAKDELAEQIDQVDEAVIEQLADADQLEDVVAALRAAYGDRWADFQSAVAAT